MSKIVISQQTRTRVNSISKERKYITRRHKAFSRQNMQFLNIGNNCRVYGSCRQLRTLLRRIRSNADDVSAN
jgi:hypothetical protein